MAQVRKKAVHSKPKEKFGFYNRINMTKHQYDEIQAGRQPKVLLTNGMINSCVPDEFRFIIQQQQESFEKILKTRHMSKDIGFEIDFKQHLYVNYPKPARKPIEVELSSGDEDENGNLKKKRREQKKKTDDDEYEK